MSRLIDIIENDLKISLFPDEAVTPHVRDALTNWDGDPTFHLRTEQFFGFPTSTGPNVFQFIQVYGVCPLDGDLHLEYVNWGEAHLTKNQTFSPIIHTDWPRTYLRIKYSLIDWSGAILVRTLPERITTRQGISRIRRAVVGARTVGPPSLSPYPSGPQLPRGYAVGHVYSDGSLTRNLPLSSAFTGLPPPSALIARGAVYYGPLNACATQIRFSPRDYVSSAFATEVVSLAYAIATTHPEDSLHTDCQSIVTTINKRRQFNNRPCGTLLAIIQAQAHRISWQKGHPERTTLLNWTPDQQGIYMADQVASAKDTIATNAINIPIRVITSETALSAMKRLRLFYVGDQFGPLIDDVAEHYYSLSLRAYLHQRDQYAMAQGRTPKWATAWPQGAAETCSLPSLSISKAASTTRVLYDKLWHGANQAKAFDTDTPEWLEAKNCKCCNIAPDSLAHLVLQCDHTDMVAARSLHLALINTHISSLRGVNNEAHTLLSVIRDHFLGPMTPDIRPALGMWTPALWNQFAAGKPRLSRCSPAHATVKKAYRELVEICLRMAVEMAATKRRIEKHGANPFRHFKRPRPPPEPPPSFRLPPPGTQEDVIT